MGGDKGKGKAENREWGKFQVRQQNKEERNRGKNEVGSQPTIKGVEREGSKGSFLEGNAREGTWK